MKNKKLNFCFARIKELREIAGRDEIIISTESEKDMIKFLCKTHFTNNPFITLKENGDYYVSWVRRENEHKYKISIQFCGDGFVNYVLLCSDENFNIDKPYGRVAIDNIEKTVHQFGLAKVWFYN